MLRLNVNEAKQLTFEVQIGGVHGENINSFFRIVFEDIEYGFPAKVGRESITVDLPPLSQVVGRKIKEGDEVEVKLEIVADGHYLTPWSDRAKLSNPLVIEAKIRDDSFTPNPTLQTKLIISEDGARHKTIVKEKEETQDDITDKIVERLSEKFAELMKPKVEVKTGKVKTVQESKRKIVKEKDEDEVEDVKDEPVEDSKKNAASETMEQLVLKTIQRLDLNRENKTPSTKKREKTLEEFKQNLTREDIFKYMEKAGTKNQKIQEIVYEQAVAAAKNNKPVEVLRQVINIMKKNKS